MGIPWPLNQLHVCDPVHQMPLKLKKFKYAHTLPSFLASHNFSRHSALKTYVSNKRVAAFWYRIGGRVFKFFF